MGLNVEDVIAELDPTERHQVEEMAAAFIEEEMTLRELRKAHLRLRPRARAHPPDPSQGASTTTITYIGTVFEQVATTGAATKRVHYLFAGTRRIALYTKDDAPTPTETLRYWSRRRPGLTGGLMSAVGDNEVAVLEVWGEHAVVSSEMGAGSWDEGGEASDEVDGVEHDRTGAVTEGVLE